jgi:hypothetical protein
MVSLKHFWGIMILALLGSSLGLAQSSNAYVVAGFGGENGSGGGALGQAAVGGEWVAWKNIGVGGEIGGYFGHATFATPSISGYFHFPPVNRDKKVDPFVTAGYTASIELFNVVHMANFGIGVNYWLFRHVGLRGEFRDLVPTSGNNIWGFRFGVVLH